MVSTVARTILFPPAPSEDEEVFGWDQTPGIVSVWADRNGQALIWQRVDERVICTRDCFRPWLFATTLADLAHLGARLVPTNAPGAEHAPVTFRELDGPDGAYRYLLSAQTWPLLERLLLTGASRRVCRPVSSLYDLDETYYRVGAVEQYLMATGRVYFRGMAYSDLHRLQFDLETTALDPQRGRIFLCAVRDNRGLMTILEAPSAADEPRLIADLVALIQSRDPDVIENHNLHGFDLPFLVGRAAALGVSLELGRSWGPRTGAGTLERYGEAPVGPVRRRQRPRYSVVGRELIDTLDAVWRYDFAARDLPSHRLKDVARHFGVASSERVYIPGPEVYATYRATPDLVRRYALDDVAEVDALSQRLLGAVFALAGMAPRRYERLASAGPAMGILEPMLVRAYLRAGAALPSTPADGADYGPHAGGALHLFAVGVAEQVVKADIASLYPSLMRIYGIGPSCDHLGVLLRIVSRLTDLRLAHKAAARVEVPGSLEAGRHTATHSAMKVLINSAYGYMGAGAMALFADRFAADEVTRRGREVLGQVVDALRERGMALIEADTDGVYFAVPSGWTEPTERALVEEVGRNLPAGIRLEYEGRYRAMFSHEVKNYALLTWNGHLVMRGVALRSSRSEPFGERFLRSALHHTLVGDIAGLREVFIQTVSDLRARALPAADVASRVRLSKTPTQYLAQRASRSEGAYEALLAAGRTEWAAGERVRFYRVRGGSYIWLPDETDDAPAGDRQHASSGPTPAELADRRDYDVDYYVQVLVTSYAGRLRKAFPPAGFEQLFRDDQQAGLFDEPLERITPIWIRCEILRGLKSDSFLGQPVQ